MIKSIIKLGFFSVLVVLVLQSNTNQKQKTEKVQTQVKFADTPEGKAEKIIYEMEQVNGGWSHLLAKKDVEFEYEYHDYAKGKDISTERFIFEGETSFAKYTKHEVNVFPKQEGEATQFLIDGNISTTLAGKEITDKEAVVFSKFMREVNPFWFSMMYKLSDPSVQPTFEGVENVNGIDYNKVAITYSDTGKEADDAYILYFNPESKLVDFFYFSLPFAGIDKPVLKMELKYEKIDGVLIATERTGVFPNPETGEYTEGGKYLTKNIKFNNGFNKANIHLNLNEEKINTEITSNQKLTIVARILAKPEKRELVKNELLKLIDITRAEKGCINYDLHQDNENENLFLFYENWENRELWQIHMNNTHLTEFMKATDGAVEELIINEMTPIK